MRISIVLISISVSLIAISHIIYMFRTDKRIKEIQNETKDCKKINNIS